MRNIQLEFDFVNEVRKKAKRNFFLDHFRPQIGWIKPPEEMKEDLEWDSTKGVWKNVVDHLKIGLAFKWKF